MQIPHRRNATIALAILFSLTPLAPTPAGAQENTTPNRDSEPGFLTDLGTRSTLFGTVGGLRSTLGDDGITVNGQETSEILGNVTGGIHQSALYDGVTAVTLQLDTAKALGWDGGLFNVSALQIHGRSLSAENLASLQTASGIEAERATRLWELWYQQSFLNGNLDAKIGQQSIDQEFMLSTNSALFLNTMMGWPMVPSADLYAGGPAFPLSSPALRLRGEPTGNLTLLAGAFDDNPGGGAFTADGQALDGGGTKFNFGTGALFIAEAQYAIDQPATGDNPGGKNPAGLPGTYRLGAWYDTASYPDQRYDNTGLSLADPGSTGINRRDLGNVSGYGVVDQMVWRPSPESPRSLNVFARAMGAPGDRNLIDFSINSGLTLKAPLGGRDNDTVGIGYGLAKISGGAAGLNRDTALFSGSGAPVRSVEHFIEATYQAEVTPWLLLQPDFQYVFRPGGGLQNPNDPSTRIGNEAVVGTRLVITL